jgi:hypothetical protein
MLRVHTGLLSHNQAFFRPGVLAASGVQAQAQAQARVQVFSGGQAASRQNIAVRPNHSLKRRANSVPSGPLHFCGLSYVPRACWHTVVSRLAQTLGSTNNLPSMPPTEKTQSTTERLLLQPAGRLLEQLVGIASCILGALLFAATCFLLQTVFTNKSSPSFTAYAVLLVVGALATLLLTAGFRLLLARPNKVGSLFAPSLWFILSAVMLCLAVLITFTIRTETFGAGAQASTSALLFALLSYGAGMHFRKQRKSGAA